MRSPIWIPLLVNTCSECLLTIRWSWKRPLHKTRKTCNSCFYLLTSWAQFLSSDDVANSVGSPISSSCSCTKSIKLSLSLFFAPSICLSSASALSLQSALSISPSIALLWQQTFGFHTSVRQRIFCIMEFLKESSIEWHRTLASCHEPGAPLL